MNNVHIRLSDNNEIILNTRGEHELWINQHNVIKGTGKKIISMVVTQTYVVIVTDDPDLHGKSVADSYSENRKGNLIAFLQTGEIAWKINDLVDSLHFPFSSGKLATEKELASFQEWHNVVFDPHHEYYIGFNDAGGFFLIDLTNRKLVFQGAFRF